MFSKFENSEFNEDIKMSFMLGGLGVWRLGSLEVGEFGGWGVWGLGGWIEILRPLRSLRMTGSIHLA